MRFCLRFYALAVAVTSLSAQHVPRRTPAPLIAPGPNDGTVYKRGQSTLIKIKRADSPATAAVGDASKDQIFLQACPEELNQPVQKCSACGGDSKQKGYCDIKLLQGAQTPICQAMGGCGKYCKCISDGAPTTTANGGGPIIPIIIPVVPPGFIPPPPVVPKPQQQCPSDYSNTKCSDCKAVSSWCTAGPQAGCPCKEDCPAAADQQPQCLADDCKGSADHPKCTIGPHKDCDCKKDCPTGTDKPECADDACKGDKKKCTQGQENGCDCLDSVTGIADYFSPIWLAQQGVLVNSWRNAPPEPTAAPEPWCLHGASPSQPREPKEYCQCGDNHATLYPVASSTASPYNPCPYTAAPGPTLVFSTPPGPSETPKQPPPKIACNIPGPPSTVNPRQAYFAAANQFCNGGTNWIARPNVDQYGTLNYYWFDSGHNDPRTQLPAYCHGEAYAIDPATGKAGPQVDLQGASPLCNAFAGHLYHSDSHVIIQVHPAGDQSGCQPLQDYILPLGKQCTDNFALTINQCKFFHPSPQPPLLLASPATRRAREKHVRTREKKLTSWRLSGIPDGSKDATGGGYIEQSDHGCWVWTIGGAPW